jgi:uncharacterized integral membrane protein
LVILLSCPSSFGHCIVLSFFFWSFYCLVLLLLVILLSCPSSFGHSICNDQKKKDKTMQWPKEGQDNAMTKRRRTRQCNDQKKKDKTIEWPKEEEQDNRMFFFWSLYCFVLLILVILLSCSSSFGHSIVLFFFFWSLYCLVLLLVILLSCPSFGHCILLSFLFQKKDKTMQWPKEGKTIEWPKEEGQYNAMTKRRRTRQ